ncbi:MAG: hypothetical protein K6T81_04325 [Alicyclobacillus macrosporangiidus]|nr:hypothetical protein [Alicyclobacillus macrosporangiidus]
MNFDIREAGERVVQEVTQEMLARAYPASNELRNAAMYVLRGQRSGRVYRVPGTKRTYTASAPGEPPAVRTGTLRASWQTWPKSERNGDATVIKPAIESVVPYNKYLDPHFGDGREPTKILPRPYVDPIRERAMPKIARIYRRPYLKG